MFIWMSDKTSAIVQDRTENSDQGNNTPAEKKSSKLLVYQLQELSIVRWMTNII